MRLEPFEKIMVPPAPTTTQPTFPEIYERWLAGPLFRPWAAITLDEVMLSPGDRVLDVACGTGIVARVAMERAGGDGRIVGVDVSPDMLAVARAVAPTLDWREGNAGALPLGDDEQFDVVVCQQGLQFFPDRPTAVAEMRRALADGGRLALTTWRPDDEAPFFRELRHVAERHLGPIVDRRHGFGEAAPIEALLGGAGFDDVRSKTLSQTIRFEDGAPLLRLNTMALLGMSARGKDMPDAERNAIVEAIVTESAPVLQRYAQGSGVAFALGCNLTIATA